MARTHAHPFTNSCFYHGLLGDLRWQEQPKRDRSAFGARYALIVSIQTDAKDVDIWTPGAQQVGIPIQAIEVEL